MRGDMDQQFQKGLTFLSIFWPVLASPPSQHWAGTKEMFVLVPFSSRAKEESEGRAHTGTCSALHHPQGQGALSSGQFLTYSILPKQLDPY